ncbi:type IV secretion system DNA-binding domain-containing protein [Patescibacteria group bacterium]|nr:type IV secretion system DNA-binding domain-containing protein [Patescibacteria group bacterium]
MDEDVTLFGETTFRNQNHKFGIKLDDRRRHMYVIGKSGMGKSTLLENMIAQDINKGRGLAVVDPHGDLAEKIIHYIPDKRIEEVVYFNPADAEYPIAFNVVEQVDPRLRHLVASGLIGVFQKLWADSWGPRLEYILRNAILAVLDYPDSTLLAITRMLSDKNFRKRVVEKIQDPVVKAFWVNEFSSYNDKFASEAVAPIQNKVGQFLSSSLIRNIVGQVRSSIDLRDIMDNGKILIMNLSKGRIGEDNSALLGSMMITKLQLAAMSRVDTPEEERRDFFLYVDEFQNFATDSFANILSEARKYHLSLILAHQYIDQLTDSVRAAVFGNVGTLITFRVGATDAEFLAKEFLPLFTEEDLVNIPKFNFYLKLMIDGITSDPFSARTLPPLSKDEQTNNVDKVIEYTRSHYANRRDIVEEEIMRWHLNQGGVAERENRVVNVLEQPEDLNSTTKMDVLEQRFPAVCDGCGQPTTVPFKPDGQRPVYCPDCLKRYRAERSERQRLLQSSPSQLDHLEGASLRQIHRPNISKNNNKGNNGQSSH